MRRIRPPGRIRPRSSVTLSQRGAGVWHLAGVLDMTSVPTLRDLADALVDAPEVLVDLCDVKRMGSAGLALLVDW